MNEVSDIRAHPTGRLLDWLIWISWKLVLAVGIFAVWLAAFAFHRDGGWVKRAELTPLEPNAPLIAGPATVPQTFDVVNLPEHLARTQTAVEITFESGNTCVITQPSGHIACAFVRGATTTENPHERPD